MGPYRSVMLGAPTFVEGEEVVVFLAASGPAIPHLVGLAQGVFRVRTDVATGARLVTPEIVRMPGAATRSSRCASCEATPAGGPRRWPHFFRKCARWPGGRSERGRSRAACCSRWPSSQRFRRPRTRT